MASCLSGMSGLTEHSETLSIDFGGAAIVFDAAELEGKDLSYHSLVSKPRTDDGY